ncbi:hypothetical protein DVH24_014302, partial [Malus domestica]
DSSPNPIYYPLGVDRLDINVGIGSSPNHFHSYSEDLSILAVQKKIDRLGKRFGIIGIGSSCNGNNGHHILYIESLAMELRWLRNCARGKACSSQNSGFREDPFSSKTHEGKKRAISSRAYLVISLFQGSRSSAIDSSPNPIYYLLGVDRLDINVGIGSSPNLFHSYSENLSILTVQKKIDRLGKRFGIIEIGSSCNGNNGHQILYIESLAMELRWLRNCARGKACSQNSGFREDPFSSNLCYNHQEKLLVSCCMYLFLYYMRKMCMVRGVQQLWRVGKCGYLPIAV